ncbi:MAG: hypothetical protein WC880_00895 [Candidatus Paceibacterota bacterium]
MIRQGYEGYYTERARVGLADVTRNEDSLRKILKRARRLYARGEYSNETFSNIEADALAGFEFAKISRAFLKRKLH